MPSAFLDSRGWIADFRPPAVSGKKRRRVRVPVAAIRSARSAKADALAYAVECASLSTLLSATTAPAPHVLARALELKAITPDEAQRLAPNVAALLSTSAAQLGPIVAPKPQRLTLEDAADAHPSTPRESHADYRRHLTNLRDFVAWSGVEHVDALTLDLALRWVAHLRATKYSFDGRRHALLWLRRASRMGAVLAGLPDPLVGFTLDRRETVSDVKAWSLPELAAAWRALSPPPKSAIPYDPRPLAALALGALCGLRSSEIYRLRRTDVDLATDPPRIVIGSQGAKNAASRRALPLPAIVAEALALLLAARRPHWADRYPNAPRRKAAPRSKPDAGDALFLTAWHGGRGEFRPNTWPHWIRPLLAGATGRDLPPKCLRSSFATWAARAGFNRDHIERYLGHTISGSASITARHYLADYAIAELTPTALAIDVTFRAALAAAEN